VREQKTRMEHMVWNSVVACRGNRHVKNARPNTRKRKRDPWGGRIKWEARRVDMIEGFWFAGQISIKVNRAGHGETEMKYGDTTSGPQFPTRPKRVRGGGKQTKRFGANQTKGGGVCTTQTKLGLQAKRLGRETRGVLIQ